MQYLPAAALLVCITVLAGCMPPPGNEPLTPREKREAIEEYRGIQHLRGDADKSADGVCGTATGVDGVRQRESRGIGASIERPHAEACPP
jgi:hypothetical protein